MASQLTFKKYTEFLMSEDADYSDEQLNELFGRFSNVDRVAKAKADREAFRNKLKGTEEDRDQLWLNAKEKAKTSPGVKKPLDPKNIDSKLKDKVWSKAKQRIETRSPQFATEDIILETVKFPFEDELQNFRTKYSFRPGRREKKLSAEQELQKKEDLKRMEMLEFLKHCVKEYVPDVQLMHTDPEKLKRLLDKHEAKNPNVIRSGPSLEYINKSKGQVIGLAYLKVTKGIAVFVLEDYYNPNLNKLTKNFPDTPEGYEQACEYFYSLC